MLRLKHLPLSTLSLIVPEYQTNHIKFHHTSLVLHLIPFVLRNVHRETLKQPQLTYSLYKIKVEILWPVLTFYWQRRAGISMF